MEVLHEVAASFAEIGDDEQAKKLRELSLKLDRSEMEIACCGHFSAGKSTLVNKLCGETLLPSSPIPTSANIVTLRYGPDCKAKIRRRDNVEKVVAVQDLSEACKDGELIEEVVIEYPWTRLDKSLVLFDTPGIDSTDEAHHLTTASALHRAEVVLYVMDYNHVQSEINFVFLKKMAEMRKPLYIIVNQIDKHREQELSFQSFRMGVEKAFKDWGMQPAGIFFVSLKVLDHPYNEWEALLQFLRELPQYGQALLQHNVQHAFASIIDAHGAWLKQQQSSKRAQLEASLSSVDTDRLLSRREELNKQIATVEQKPDLWMQSIKQDVERLIENANVIPAKTREFVQSVLESRQPGFKTGWFRSAAKTEAERAKRLQDLKADFSEQIKVHLYTHLVRLFGEQSDALGLDRTMILGQLENWDEIVNERKILDTIPSGSGATGEAVLNFSNRLAANVKQYFRKTARDLLMDMHMAFKHQLEPERQQLLEVFNDIQQQLRAYEQLQEMDKEVTDAVQQLHMRLRQVTEEDEIDLPIPDIERKPVSTSYEMDGTAMRDTTSFGPDLSNQSGVDFAAPEGKWLEHLESDMTHTAQLLIRAADELQDIPALASTVSSLNEKAERLKQRSVSLALFGAFSAGKSSFANALLGMPVLPVSPNPTTAVINRIAPPSPEWENGTACIQLKTKERLQEELFYSLDQLGVEANTIEEALTKINRIDVHALTPKGRPHYAFLQAVSQGWELEHDKLGTSIKADLSLYREYAAMERRSCFVEEIELYVDSPITRSGMTLVDTPGADSINARHTNVAFNYMKNADAILFVTYYNHAFSQADKMFLDQLGRVKDSFELDKMFFLVNAADLAASEEELATVLGHVRDRLIEHGIRDPRIFPISSVLALEGKQQGHKELLQQSGIDPFERQFFSFILEDWGELILHAARQELERAKTRLTRWIDQAQDGEQKRQAELARLRQAQVQFNQQLQEPVTDHDLQDIRSEAEELVYYVRQRIQYRFREFFTLAFNPASLRAGQGDIQQALQEAWKELIRLLSYELSQEMLATTLRMEKKLLAMLDNEREKLQQKLQEHFEDMVLPEPMTLDAGVPHVEEELTVDSPQVKWLVQHFKNAKQFFEGDGSRKLQEQLELRLQPVITSYAEAHVARFSDYYQALYDQWRSIRHQQILQTVKEFIQGLSDLNDQKLDVAALNQKCLKLQSILEQLPKKSR